MKQFSHTRLDFGQNEVPEPHRHAIAQQLPCKRQARWPGANDKDIHALHLCWYPRHIDEGACGRAAGM